MRFSFLLLIFLSSVSALFLRGSKNSESSADTSEQTNPLNRDAVADDEIYRVAEETGVPEVQDEMLATKTLSLAKPIANLKSSVHGLEEQILADDNKEKDEAMDKKNDSKEGHKDEHEDEDGVLGEISQTYSNGDSLASRQSNKANEDTFLVGHVRDRADKAVRVYAVFDGHRGGDASSYLKTHFLENLELFAESTDLESALSLALKKVDEDFWQLHTADAHKMGSCALVLAVTKTHVYSANLGDSFAIMVPNLNEAGQGQTWTPLNELLNAANENERARISAQKETYPEDKRPRFKCEGMGSCYVHAGKSRGLQPTRTIGDKDLYPVVTSMADIRKFEIPEGGARVVLASDGLSDKLSHKTMAETARQAESPKVAVKMLMQRSFEEAAKRLPFPDHPMWREYQAERLLRLMRERAGLSRKYIDDTTVVVFDVAGVAKTPS